MTVSNGRYNAPAVDNFTYITNIAEVLGIRN